MLEFDATSERFRQLFDLINDAAGERGIGQERLPFVRQIGAEVRHNRAARSGLVQLRALKLVPIDAFDLDELGGCSKRHDGNSTTNFPLRANVEQVEPRDMEHKAGAEPDAIIGKTSKQEPDDCNPVTG